MGFGEPEDVPGECNALLYVADNFGDNHTTFRCRLSPGHPGNHKEEFRKGTVTIEWEVDERTPMCSKCGENRTEDRDKTICASCEFETSPLCTKCEEFHTGSVDKVVCDICGSVEDT